MDALFELRRRARAALVPVLTAAAIGYFGYHAVVGERGIAAYTRLQIRLASAEAARTEAHAVRQKLERRVALLRSSGLDLDLLEEVSRGTLGLAHRNEVIILTPR
jgi:cell division protein FtsB